MYKDPNITQFVSIINSTQLKDYFNNNNLVVFAPSNAAMSAINTANFDLSKLVKSHMYISVNPSGGYVTGTTTNWPNYEKIVSKTGTYYRAVSIDNFNVFFMYTVGQIFRVNDALLIQSDNTNGSQVYHIIDRVFVNYQDITFLKYISSIPTLSQSSKLWTAFKQAADTGLLQGISPFKSSFIDFTASLFGTILLPTDAAWGLNGVDGLLKSPNYSAINTIMSRFYIPMNLVFLTGDIVHFSAGFIDPQTQSTANLLPGLVTTDLQVRVGTYSGRVIQANIPLEYGVVHVIDNTLNIPVTINGFLEQNSKTYLKLLKDNPNASIYLNENNTFMPIDDITMAGFVNSPNLTQILLNTIISGNVTFNETKPPIKTIGGLMIKLVKINSKYYLAAYQSQSDNTWISIAQILQLNQIVGSTYVTLINGSLSPYAQTCDYLLQILNCSFYQNLISSKVNNVTLNIGSPYTMFVPNDFSLYPFVANSPLNQPIIKYTIQRMIIANRMILQTRPTGSFQAATMNYAAMMENINMTIVGTIINIQFNEYNQSFDFSGGGIYCYSNSLEDSTRYNLVYPVSFVVSSKSDTSSKFCVTAPCVACHTIYNYLLLIVVSLFTVRHITASNI